MSTQKPLSIDKDLFDSKDDDCAAQGDCQDTRELLDILVHAPRDPRAEDGAAKKEPAPAEQAGPDYLSLGAAVAAGSAAASENAGAPGPSSSGDGVPTGSDSGKPSANPKWGRAVGGPPAGAGGAIPPSGGGGGGPGGAWVWFPQGVEQKRSWRKRHPVLFWGGFLFMLLLVFGWGRLSMRDSLISGPKLAVINLEGLILDGGDVIAWIDKVRKDSSYVGAVLRINSPGGAVGPSQELYAAVKRLAQRKPVVASMGALAASGGYYAALGADEILAGPSTLTASIGVKMQVPNIEGLMRTIGVSEKTLTTGTLKDAGSSWRTMSPEEEAYFRALLTDMYDEFIETVARERNLDPVKVRTLADGRAMTGRQALAAGLVDALGDQYEAVRRVKERAGLTDETVRLVDGPEKPSSYVSDLLKSALESVLQQRSVVERPLFVY